MSSQAVTRIPSAPHLTRRAFLRRAGALLAASIVTQAPGMQQAVANVASDSKVPAPPAPGRESLARALRIDVLDRRRVPPDVNVPVGATVAWINRGDTWIGIAALDGSFDSGPIAPGAMFAHRFTRPGSYAYVCQHHAIRDMTGRIEVR